jgi:DNA-binding Lrp family transcriptional regulator
MKNLDDLDQKLIAELQNDPRKSNARLACVLGIAEPTVARRIERLVADDELVFTALPDRKKFGYNISAYLGLRTRQPSMSSIIAEQLCHSPYLRFVSSCEGFADFFVGGDFTSTEDLADFITGFVGKIDGISHIDTMVELKQVKKRTFGLGNDILDSLSSNNADITIDSSDRLLILELQKDCRSSLKKLSHTVNMSEPTVHRHIKKLVASGAIKLTALATKNLYKAQDIVGVEAEPAQLNMAATAIVRYPKVQFVGIYSGPVQILVGIYGSSPEEVSHFATQELVKTEGITRVAFLSQLKVLKRGLPWIRQ